MKIKDKFKDVWQLIENEEYSIAEKQLLEISKDKQSSAESVSYANYMIGLIYTTWNKDKNLNKARRALLYCIESEYPNPMAYFKFADIQEDKNVAINYLRSGLQQFPASPTIYSGLLKYTDGSEKVKYIDEIDSKSIVDVPLLETTIDFLVSKNYWDKAERFLLKVLSVTNISKDYKLYCTLLYSFSLIAQNKDIDVAKHNLKSIIEKDVSNEFKYSQHIGYLRCLMNKEEIDETIEIFDKIPVSSAIGDLNDGYWFPINVDFAKIYKDIFAQLRIVFAKDKKRKLKNNALEAYYLYTPSKYNDIYRFEKKHIKHLSNYLLIDKKNLDVLGALFDMQVHFRQFFDAYCTFMYILGEYLDPTQNDMYEVCFYKECAEFEIFKICDDIINRLINGFDMEMGKFMLYVFDPLINFIYSSELQDKHKHIISLAKQVSQNYLLKSNCKFEIAYSYAESNPQSDVAEKLYLEIIKNQPDNTSALNNIGVIYEKRGNLNRSVEYFQKAYNISSDENVYRRNFDRVRGLINNYEKALTEVKNENVWLLGKLNLIYTSADLQGEFSCSYQDRAKLLTLSPQKATEVFNRMLKNRYIEKVSSGDGYQANRYAINPLIKEYLTTESDRLKQNGPYDEIARGLNYDDIVRLGYTKMVENTIDAIQDLDFKEILKRDVREAAITLTTKQYKSCIVICGSVIEAILTSKIISSGYKKYDIGLLIKNKSNTKKVLEMDLNELLELAKRECLIDIGEYHLSNFVRCYRNIIHPSVELRKNYDANENNARMMWNALLLIINRII